MVLQKIPCIICVLVTTVLVSSVFQDIETRMGQFETGEIPGINRRLVSSKLVLTRVDCTTLNGICFHVFFFNLRFHQSYHAFNSPTGINRKW